MLEGIDGSGKSTAIDAWKDFLTKEGNAIFDLRNYWQKTGKYPEVEEIKSYDFIFSCEPTYTGIGTVIREELIKNGGDYSAQAIAEAYALDRLVLYKKILIPLLKDKKCVIEDRGVSTSLAYQKTQGLEYGFLTELPGNKLALENRPDYLILMKISAETAIERLKARMKKDDNAIFEKSGFLKKSLETYQSEEYQKLFTGRGTKIDYLNAELKIDIMKQEAVILLKKILTN